MPAAFIDESLRVHPPGLYVIAAVVVDQDLDTTRTLIRAVVLRRQPRFHWRDETERQRVRMLEALADIEGRVMAYTCQPVPPGKQERARAQCLKRLLWDIRDLDVDELIFESRQAHNDLRDQRTILWARTAQAAPKLLSYGFRRPYEEPLLWLSDAAAGAVAARASDDVEWYADLLGERLTITAVTF